MLDRGILRPIEQLELPRDQDISESDLELLNRGQYNGRYINDFVFLP